MELFSSDATVQRAHDTSSEIKVYFIVVQILLYVSTESPLWQRKLNVVTDSEFFTKTVA